MSYDNTLLEDVPNLVEEQSQGFDRKQTVLALQNEMRKVWTEMKVIREDETLKDKLRQLELLRMIEIHNKLDMEQQSNFELYTKDFVNSLNLGDLGINLSIRSGVKCFASSNHAKKSTNHDIKKVNSQDVLKQHHHKNHRPSSNVEQHSDNAERAASHFNKEPATNQNSHTNQQFRQTYPLNQPQEENIPFQQQQSSQQQNVFAQQPNPFFQSFMQQQQQPQQQQQNYNQFQPFAQQQMPANNSQQFNAVDRKAQITAELIEINRKLILFDEDEIRKAQLLEELRSLQ